jgi:uncharacterized protein (DUF427 family)
MQATLNGHLIAASDDTVDIDGYAYFPRAAVRMNQLVATPKTADDLRCPHGVQFYDVIVDNQRYERVAWAYEAPRASMQAAADRIGFWKDVQLTDRPA